MQYITKKTMYSAVKLTYCSITCSLLWTWCWSASNLAKIMIDLMTYRWFSENYEIKSSNQWIKGYFSCFNKNKGFKGLMVKLKAIKGFKGFKGSPGKPVKYSTIGNYHDYMLTGREHDCWLCNRVLHVFSSIILQG